MPRVGISDPDEQVTTNAEKDSSSPEIPEILPILPLRGMVVYPLMVLPLNVGQPRSVRLVDDVVVGDKFVGIVASKDPEIEEPASNEVYQLGTVAVIHRLFKAPDGTMRVIVQGVERIRIEDWTADEPYLKAKVTKLPDVLPEEGNVEAEALTRNVVDLFSRLVALVPHLPDELMMAAANTSDPRQLVYLISTSIRMDLQDAQEILELDRIVDKLRRLTNILNRELEVLELGKKIQSEAQSEMEKMQREYFLREQLKAIQRELGEGDEQQMEIEELRTKIAEADMPEEAEKEALRELSRLEKLPPAAAEYGVIRTYLDWLTSLPWSVSTEDALDITHARQVLDEDHYDLEKIKERILEYLSVRKLKAEMKGPILCFVGPPGVGKTSVGKSIARAMGRKFIRMSLGGVRDEAEIRGHRRTYVGALPGRVIQGIRKAGTNNPVFMLDEVDKLGMDFRGDPSAALLEVLDPEQNFSFSDHYLDLPFDLTKVMFITTANILDPIPPALKDRMEVIRLPGYTMPEKLNIAKQFLIPKQYAEHGLAKGKLRIADSALKEIISRYTREAGVRNLERSIATICRKTARQIVEEKIKKVSVTKANVADYLKAPPFFPEAAGRRAEVGIATGMAWTAVGGVILFIEALKMPGKGDLILTGQLGDVMQESTRAAYSYVKAHAKELGIDPEDFDRYNVHVHVPAGATPKDGPSAGVAMATAIASVFSGLRIRHDLAMTGEITLRGKVMPIGGVKEKLLAAVRAGIPDILFPEENESDVLEVEEEHRDKVNVSYAKSIGDVLKAALIGFGEKDKAEKAAPKKKRKARPKETQPVAARPER